jgi:hypothetical protein
VSCAELLGLTHKKNQCFTIMTRSHRPLGCTLALRQSAKCRLLFVLALAHSHTLSHCVRARLAAEEWRRSPNHAEFRQRSWTPHAVSHSRTKTYWSKATGCPSGSVPSTTCCLRHRPRREHRQAHRPLRGRPLLRTDAERDGGVELDPVPVEPVGDRGDRGARRIRGQECHRLDRRRGV